MLLFLALAAQAPVHVVRPTGEGAVQAAPSLKVCPVDGVVPRELAGWRTMTPVAAGATPVPVAVGTGLRATLLPAATVAYPVAPAKPGAAGTSGGVFAFEVARAGRYRVALGGAAWIEVAQAGRTLPSVAHGHGPDCSPVRKTVDFDLKPGRYLLEIVGAPAPTLALMVAALPR